MLAAEGPSPPAATPRPTYYSYALYSRAFGDKMVAAESSDPTVKVYASRFAGGGVGLVIVNENDRNQTVNFCLTGFPPKVHPLSFIPTPPHPHENPILL